MTGYQVARLAISLAFLALATHRAWQWRRTRR
jgi:hypothetical protein